MQSDPTPGHHCPINHDRYQRTYIGHDLIHSPQDVYRLTTCCRDGTSFRRSIGTADHGMQGLRDRYRSLSFSPLSPAPR